MSADRMVRGVCLAILMLGASPAWSGGAGAHGVILPGGGAFHRGGAFHGSTGFRAGGFHSGAGEPGGFHPLPPITGTIHEHGNQAYVTSYGHANTAVTIPWSRRAGVYDVGRGPAANDRLGIGAGYGDQHWRGYGQQRQWREGGERLAGSANGFGRERFGRERDERRFGSRERLRFAELRRARGFGWSGYGDGGYGGGSGYDPGGYDSADIGSYPAAETYGTVGSSAEAGSYGSAGIYPAAGVYESELGGLGFRYRSETPLPARYAEAALAPSPYGGFDAGNGYADAASRDVGPGFGPRIIHVHDEPGRCTCLPATRTGPTVLRYGVGTAY